jgi:hypothetical protein
MKFDDPSLVPLPAQSIRSLAAEQNSAAIFYGWRVVLVSALGLFWGIPIAVYSFSVFFKPLMQEFHAGRTALSLGFTVQLFVGRPVGGSRRLASRWFRSTPRDYDWDGNFRSDLGC